MAITLPYPIMSGGITPTGGASVDQFAASSVHSDAVHNNPHAKLLANDNSLLSSINSLNSSVSSVVSTIPISDGMSVTYSGGTNPGSWVTICSAGVQFYNVPTIFLVQYGVGYYTAGNFWLRVTIDGSEVVVKNFAHNSILPPVPMIGVLLAPGFSGVRTVAFEGRVWTAGTTMTFRTNTDTPIDNYVGISVPASQVAVIQLKSSLA
jgi:hypothetical protein